MIHSHSSLIDAQNIVSKIWRPKYTALLQRGTSINHSPTSLRASSQIQLFFDSDCRAISCLQEKKKKGQGRGLKNFFPQGASKPTLRQDSSQKLWFVMEKGWKSGRCWEHFMARTAYMGHLRIDDQASLWLSSYCAHLITYWENSIHHPLPTSSENNATARSSFPVRADCQEQ